MDGSMPYHGRASLSSFYGIVGDRFSLSFPLIKENLDWGLFGLSLLLVFRLVVTRKAKGRDRQSCHSGRAFLAGRSSY